MRSPAKKVLTIAAATALAFPLTFQSSLAQGKSWWLDVEGGVEYDDNVAVEQNDDNSANGDVAAVMEIDAGYKLIDEKDQRVEVGYNFYQSIYQDLSAFNYQAHNPSIMAWTKQGGIKLGAEYSYTHSMLDESFFLDQHMIAPTISAFVTEDFFVTAYYRYYDKNYNQGDDARDAKTHQTGADVYYYFDRPNKGFLSVGGGFTSEDTRGDAFDYDGFMGRASVQMPVELLAHKGKVKFSYAYQKRDYDNDASLTVLPGDKRADDRHTFRLSTEMEVTDDLKAIAEVRHITRNSNLSVSDYEENIGGLSLRYSF
jgi:hypothetical protein